MDDIASSAWVGPEASLPDSRVVDREDQLILRDRIAALEAEVAALKADSARQPSEVLSAEQRILQMQSSFAWRIGSALADPRRVVRRAFRRASPP